MRTIPKKMFLGVLSTVWFVALSTRSAPQAVYPRILFLPDAGLCVIADLPLILNSGWRCQ
jgi:hypothetical protein